MAKRGPRWRLLHAPSHPDSMAAWILRYLEAMGVLGYSKETIRNREAHLSRFHAWCLERDLSSPREVTQPILERYQRFLFYYRKENGDPLSGQVQKLALTHVRALFSWLARERHILYNPASEIQLPKVSRKTLPISLSEEEVETILAQPDVDEAIGLRDRAMLEVLYSTGIRRMELANLQVFDLDRPGHTLWVRQGKGKKDRLTPIGERALTWTRAYLDHARPRLLVDPNERSLFINRFGHGFVAGGITSLVRRYVKQSGIDKPGSCHLFRHTMATLMLNNGADVRFIQEMLGHENLDTTMRYTHVSIEKLKEIHKATHPAKMSRTEVGEDGEPAPDS